MSMGGAQQAAPTDQERALSDVSRAQYQDYRDRYVPEEGKYLESMRATPGRVGLATGLAATDATLAGAPALTAGTGRQPLRGLSAALSYGGAKGSAVAGATQAVQGRELEGLGEFTKFGRGLAMGATKGIADSAGLASQAAIQKAQLDEKRSLMVQEGLLAAGGTYLGAKGKIGGTKPAPGGTKPDGK